MKRAGILQESSDIALIVDDDNQLRSLLMAVIGSLSLGAVQMESLGK